MLTSFFAKSKPINIALVILLLAGFFISANFQNWFLDFEILKFFKILGVFLSLMFALFLLNFVAKKNDLTQRSAYKVLLFSVFCASFSSLLKDYNIIISATLILLALRRIISLKSQISVQKKIFDAGLWICIASLFYFWSILFLLIAFVGIVIYSPRPKNWLIPVISAVCVYIIYCSIHLLVKDQFYLFSDCYQAYNFNFSNYQSFKFLTPISIILALTVWSLVYYFSIIQKAGVSLRPSLNLILFTLIIGISVGILAPSKNGSELIFFFIPLSIIVSNYFDTGRDKIFREILLIILILMPFGVLFIQD
ncbi:DUF6427 family protein [Zunongwangia endophytica]|uniref:DUF6427 family protein n=1 Tax=Zunongwangia endophytica TaxID=1808945 RepID=A0ABV8H6Y0_9FLAO|nr:DUF6427 family protein [Zunongwangia endophytica]MDN3595895.1 DUF6427 family protein [Zunongwangia endophytica]